MDLTPYHAKYIAHELTRRWASDSVEKLTAVLSDAQVDLNPHQIEAALFAFRNPLSRGAILADEVGLGKTIEAGLLIAQSWAEGKRHILVIVPANLRKQWSQELADKFFLPSVILEARTFNDAIRAGNLNPFQQDAVIICSYQFARKMEPACEVGTAAEAAWLGNQAGRGLAVLRRRQPGHRPAEGRFAGRNQPPAGAEDGMHNALQPALDADVNSPQRREGREVCSLRSLRPPGKIPPQRRAAGEGRSSHTSASER